MLSETITVGDLVTRTLDVLHRHSERPELRTVQDLDTSINFQTTANILGVAGGTVLEAGYELMRVLNVAGTSAGVERQFAGTPLNENFSSVTKDPLWPRWNVLRGLSDAMANMHGQVPLMKSVELTALSGRYFLDLTAITDLWVPKRLGYFTTAGTWVDLPGWEFFDNVATTAYPGVTRFMTLPAGLTAGDKVMLTYKARYGTIDYTTPPLDSATVTVPLGARDLPALAAAGRMLSNREVSRAEIDRVEEWPQEAAIRGGWTLRAVNQLWQEYYRRVDEVVRSVKETEPRHRPYRKMQGPVAAWRR